MPIETVWLEFRICVPKRNAASVQARRHRERLQVKPKMTNIIVGKEATRQDGIQALSYSDDTCAEPWSRTRCRTLDS